MSILDIIIMLIGGFLLFWLFATIVIFPINNAIENCSKKKFDDWQED